MLRLRVPFALISFRPLNHFTITNIFFLTDDLSLMKMQGAAACGHWPALLHLAWEEASAGS